MSRWAFAHAYWLPRTPRRWRTSTTERHPGVLERLDEPLAVEAVDADRRDPGHGAMLAEQVACALCEHSCVQWALAGYGRGSRRVKPVGTVQERGEPMSTADVAPSHALRVETHRGHTCRRRARRVRRADRAGDPGGAQRAVPAGPGDDRVPADLDLGRVPRPGDAVRALLRRARRPVRPQAAAADRRRPDRVGELVSVLTPGAGTATSSRVLVLWIGQALSGLGPPPCSRRARDDRRRHPHGARARPLDRDLRRRAVDRRLPLAAARRPDRAAALGLGSRPPTGAGRSSSCSACRGELPGLAAVRGELFGAGGSLAGLAGSVHDRDRPVRAAVRDHPGRRRPGGAARR